jgi:hypothetical protein
MEVWNNRWTHGSSSSYCGSNLILGTDYVRVRHIIDLENKKWNDEIIIDAILFLIPQEA